jgi:protein involved in polysaccharide export with SLBB domain
MQPIERQSAGRRPRLGRVALAACALAVCLLGGCASLTNPVANGVPVRILPDELLAPSKEGFEFLPLTLLRQPPPEAYILAEGDILGVQGIYGDAATPPPVTVPDTADLPPAIGYPVPIRPDGTISLPYIRPVQVAGLTIEQAEEKVVASYIDNEIFLPNDRRIVVTLMRPRYVRVLIIRDDSQQRQISLQTESLLGLGTSRTRIGGNQPGTGMVLELPAYQNDVLTALTRSGGLPGLESTQEVIIQRGYWNHAVDPTGGQIPPATAADLTAGNGQQRRMIRIPLRLRPGQGIPFSPTDITLQNGDIVTVRSREPEFYYTAGLLPTSEIPLPNDYDLTVVEAIIKSGGSVLNGGVNTSNLNGAVIQSGVGNPSPSQLSIVRKTPNDGQVVIRVDLNDALRDPRENILIQDGDVLVLQESPDEAITRYFSQVFQADVFVRWLSRSDAQGSASLVVP